MSDPTSYVLRIQRDEFERQLFSRRTFYVNIRRDWSRGTVVLFMKKDAFVGSGIIEKFAAVDDLEEPEKKLCAENNWYGKIVFARLVRFLPVIPVQDTPASIQNPLVLHGASITGRDAIRIEKQAGGRIVS